VITAVLLSVVVTYEFQAAANPIGGSKMDAMHQNNRDAVNGSHLAVPLKKALSKPVIAIFQPVLPLDPQIFFGPGPVTP